MAFDGDAKILKVLDFQEFFGDIGKLLRLMIV